MYIKLTSYETPLLWLTVVEKTVFNNHKPSAHQLVAVYVSVKVKV